MFNPISESAMPTGDSGNLLKFINVKGYYLNTQETTRGGVDRFRADMRVAADVWNLAFNPIYAPFSNFRAEFLPGDVVPPGTFEGTSMDALRKVKNLFEVNPFYKALLDLHAARFSDITEKVVAVFYLPFRGDTGAAIALAFQNVYHAATQKTYQVIIMGNKTNSGRINSALAHELGHVMYATATRFRDPAHSDDVVPINNNCDPTNPGCTNQPFRGDNPYSHSPLPDNVMFAGGKGGVANPMVILPEQRDKASSTFLFY